VSNRISLGTDWTRASADVAPGTDFQTYRHPVVPTTIADHRLAATAACVARGAADLDPLGLMAALRDHGTGPWSAPDAVPPPSEPGADHRGITVCMHVRGQQNTTASMAVTVAPDREQAIHIRAALGNPCVSVYLPFDFGDAVPAPLGDERTWGRFARLRDRVERDGAAITGIRAALAPLEADDEVQEPDWARLDRALAGLGV
jgi:hypothetical protein